MIQRRGSFNFALPIFAVGFFVGVLCAEFIPFWSVCVAGILSAAQLRSQNSYLIFVFGFACGYGRAALQRAIPVVYAPNPFLIFAAETQAHFAVLHDAAARALGAGLVLGGMGGFTTEWKQVFRATGTSHIVAVSGSNITILSEWITALLVQLRLQPRQRTVLLTIILFAFVCITGAPQSVVRAALMAGFAEIARLFGRPAHGLHALGAATLLIGLANPYAFFDIGFQLSAAATLGIIIAAAPVRKSAWVEALHATVSATLCTLPLSIYYFSSTSAIALMANIVIVPLVPLLMAAAGWAYVVSFLPAWLYFLAAPSESALRLALGALQLLAHIPGSLMRFDTPLWAVVVWYMCVTAWAATYAARQIRPP